MDEDEDHGQIRAAANGKIGEIASTFSDDLLIIEPYHCQVEKHSTNK